MQKSDGGKFHGIFILPFRVRGRRSAWMLGFTGEKIQGVGEEVEDGAEGAFGAAGAAGKVEDEGATGNAADTATERGEGGVPGTVLADELGEAGDETVADGEGGLGRDVAGSEAGAAGGEDEIGADGCSAQGGGKDGKFVGEDESVDEPGTGLGEDLGDGGAGEVGLGSGRAAVADGDDDGGSASEGRGGRHGLKHRVEGRLKLEG